jgi:hypothetical protein
MAFHFQYDLASSNVGIAQYNISSAAGLSAIWDITDLTTISKIENNKQDTFPSKQIWVF